MPTLSARVRVSSDEPADSSAARPYAIRGDAQQMRAEIAKWEDLGVEFLACWFGDQSLETYLGGAERFARVAVG